MTETDKLEVYTVIKAIAIDMDGTLLNKSQKVSKENKEAIERAQACGIEVIIATGRTYQEASFALDETNLECPVIGVNGAVILTKSGEITASNTMDKQDVKKVVDFLEQKHIYFEIYTSEGTYSKDYEKSAAALVDVYVTANPDIDRVEITQIVHNRLTLGQVKTIGNYAELLSRDDLSYYKLLVFSNDLELLGKTGGELKQVESLAVTSSGHGNLEISHESAQKGIALEIYLQDKGINLSEAMAIGDNFNDVSMFERVGRAVAMGNAPQEIKKICHMTTGMNDESGVAQAIHAAINEQMVK